MADKASAVIKNKTKSGQTYKNIHEHVFQGDL